MDPGLRRDDDGLQGVVTITVLATEGSAPRGPGTAMTVTRDAASGTIGGGQLEYRAIEQARLLLEGERGWLVQDYPLGPLLGQCCGGRVRLLIERGAVGAGEVLAFTEDAVLREDGVAMIAGARGLRPEPGDRIACPADAPRVPVMLFGAGHVGRAVARAVEGLPFLLQWFDGRAEFGEIPGVTAIGDEEVEACLAAASPDAAVLVMTHDHGLDYRLVRAALAGPARFVGLIGSATKRARFTARLLDEGVPVDRLTCPIGIPGIAGKEPAVIAASVAAQLLIECGV